jgi:hypothetical protein
MENQTIKTIETKVSNYLSTMTAEEMLNAAQSNQFTHAWGYSYNTQHHIDNGDYSQEARDLCENKLADMVSDHFCNIMEWGELDMINNPEEYGLDADDVKNGEHGYWDEDGTNWMKFNNYVSTLIQEAIENIEIEERTELLESHGFEITDNSTIEVDAEYTSDNVNVSITIYEDWDFSVNATDDDGEDIDYDGHMDYEKSKYISKPFMKELQDAPNRYSKEAFAKWLPQFFASVKEEASKVMA